MFIYTITTVAEVCNTGRGERGNVQQAVTALEGHPCKDLLTQRFLQDRKTDRETEMETKEKQRQGE